MEKKTNRGRYYYTEYMKYRKRLERRPEEEGEALPASTGSPKMADMCGQVLLGSGLTVLSHPLMYIKVLIQVRNKHEIYLKIKRSVRSPTFPQLSFVIDSIRQRAGETGASDVH